MASTVSQTIDDIRSFRPMDIKFIQRCINDFLDEKYHNGIPNHMNYGAHIERCPKCGSVHFVKNGFDYNHKQKYRCKDCNTVFSATTGTMFSNSPVSFDTWRTFITGELNGLTLQQQSAATRLSVTTCFHMRHKLYAAISIIQDQVVLEGNIELDPAYTKINLKGTKPENMPRLSKHRGKHKSVFSKDIRGISGHKICLVTAIDENDNMLFKIGGLGGESQEILEQFTDHFQKDSMIISDSKKAIIKFALNNGMRSDSIPTSPTKTHFTTPLGNSLGSVNELHTEAKNMIRQKHGVGTRHLQGYLDWILFRKQMRYRYEVDLWADKAYEQAMREPVPFTCDKIRDKTMPIDLYQAYGSYHYGIYDISTMA